LSYLLCVRGGGGFFVPPWLDPVEFRCLIAIRVVEFCFLELDPVVVVIPWQKTSRDFGWRTTFWYVSGEVFDLIFLF
jgi:hypothetical protein